MAELEMAQNFLLFKHVAHGRASPYQEDVSPGGFCVDNNVLDGARW